jgi:methanethiol S-methyltransferase
MQQRETHVLENVPLPMIQHHIILASLWLSYCCLHSVLASITVKEKLKRLIGHYFKYYRIFYTLFAFFGLIGLLYYQVKLPTLQFYAVTQALLLAGIILGGTGLFIMLICIKKYFISISGLLSIFQEKPASNLMVDGIHQYVRHPLYSGTFAFIWGLFICMPYLSLVIMNTIITIYTLIGINLEEQKLIAEFGDDYRNYQQEVPMLLPILKLKRVDSL